MLITTKSGKTVVITPIKHGSLRINFAGMEIEVDPAGKLPPVTDYAALPKADLVLVTHEHFDHCDKQAIEALQKPGTVTVVNAASAQQLGFGNVMKNGETFAFSPEVTIEAVPAYNTSASKQQFHPRGRDNGYILTLDGLRIYIAGDTEVIDELSALTDIDVAFLPCNLPYTMTPEQLDEAARKFMPRVLFPYHYSDTKIERVVELLEGSGIDVRIRPYQ
ncbi:MAG: MBL fold metallo-hydrolase [Bacteroidales bacterium]|nr:MBL fold metallo-hydrolase [Bacteroidales bacterium]